MQIDTSTSNASQMLAFSGGMLFLCLFATVLVLIPTWKICKKAGFTPWLSLLIFIPIGGIILLYIVAFSPWKTPQGGPDYGA